MNLTTLTQDQLFETFAADLRKIATELGIAVPASMKDKGEMEVYLARNMMAYGMTSES